MPDICHLYALLIGINEYESRSLRPLEFAVADVLEFGSFLHERAGLPEDRCVKLTSSAGPTVSRPSRSRLLAAFDRFAQTPMSIEDTFILYFAGHAFAVEGETFLMACDSEPGSKDLLTASAVSLRALEPFLRRIRAGQQLLILDACRNEPHGQARGSAGVKWDPAMTRDIQALAAPSSGGQVSRRPSRHGRAILSACWENSVAFEYPVRRHSWFCHHVLETLRQVSQGPVEFTHQWVEQLGRRMRESAPLLLPEAAAQEPHLILDGSPVRLDLAPRRGLTIPTAPDPAQVVVQEVAIAPLQVEVAPLAGEQVAAPGLPPIPGDILELEGRIQGLEQAIQQLQSGTHPSLRPAQSAVRLMEAQWQALAQDLNATAPALPKKILERLRTEAVKQPSVPLSQLCTLVPELPTGILLPYVQRLRNVDRANAALEKARQDYEDARQSEVKRLESELAAAQNTLKARKQEDLTSVLDMFFERQGDPADFPIEAWNVFEPALLSRRYPWSDREILRRAEQVLQNRRERQKQERARQEQRLRKQRDQDDWLNTLSNPNSVALAEYLKRWPQGLHAEEAQQRIEHIKEDEAWQKVQQSSSMQDLCKFRKRFPKGRYASAVAEREAMLWRRIKRRKMTLEACLLGLALVLVLFAGKQALDQWRAWQERARQQRVHQEAVRQEQERARHEQVREEQAEKVRLRKEGEVAVASVKAGDTRVLDLGQGVTMELCGIPAGEFLMGSTKAAREWAAGPEGQGKAEWFTDEGEAPRLTRVSLSFWLGRTEATVGQWKRFVAENGYRTDAEKAGKAWCWDWDKNKWDWVKGRSWHDPNYGFGVRDEHPVSCVSWNDAMAFCKWMTESERAAGRLPNGLEYRLPTEAEWEYACRGGREGTRFWWGDSVAEGQGRLNAASDDKLGHKLPDATWSGKFPWSDGYAWASPVDAFGAKGRNGFGLADMLGNVWEWCLDGYDAKGAHEEAYRGDTSMRVLRGGSFNYAPGYVRCAHRDGDTPTLAYAYFGFRVVLGVVR